MIGLHENPPAAEKPNESALLKLARIQIEVLKQQVGRLLPVLRMIPPRGDSEGCDCLYCKVTRAAQEALGTVVFTYNDDAFERVLLERNALKAAAESYLTEDLTEELERWANLPNIAPRVAEGARRQLQLRAAIGMVETRGE